MWWKYYATSLAVSGELVVQSTAASIDKDFKFKIYPILFVVNLFILKCQFV